MQAHPRDDVRETLMHDVCTQIGKVLERERSTAEMAELVWREQQRLLQRFSGVATQASRIPAGV